MNAASARSAALNLALVFAHFPFAVAVMAVIKKASRQLGPAPAAPITMSVCLVFRVISIRLFNRIFPSRLAHLSR